MRLRGTWPPRGAPASVGVLPPVFLIQRWTATGFLPARGEPGRQRSESLDCWYRLDSREGPLGGQDFDLVEV